MIRDSGIYYSYTGITTFPITWYRHPRRHINENIRNEIDEELRGFMKKVSTPEFDLEALGNYLLTNLLHRDFNEFLL